MTPQQIIKEVCKYYATDKHGLFNKSHEPHLAERKHMVRKLLREDGLTLHQIGDLTDCSHDNALHGIKKAQDLIDTDKQFRENYYAIKSSIGGKIVTLWDLAECWTYRLNKLYALNHNGIASDLIRDMKQRMVEIVIWGKKLNLK